jgi:hypothetical protein
MPVEASRGGCAFMVSGFAGTPISCERAVTHAGLVWFPGPRRLWWAFACVEHACGLEVPRLLLERDHAELARRRGKHAAALAGRGQWVPDPPLATGAEGLRLLEQAREWASRHVTAAQEGSCDTH